MKTSFALASMVLLAGCANYKPVPDNYTGSVATVADTGMRESRSTSKAQIFSMIAVDGQAIDNAFTDSRAASANQGPTITLRLTERRIPVRTMKVTLKASHATGAPIHEFASRAAGTFFSVEGVVDFSPRADTRYVVKGVLAKGKGESSVWIEDAVTHEVVTDKVIEQP